MTSLRDGENFDERGRVDALENPGLKAHGVRFEDKRASRKLGSST